MAVVKDWAIEAAVDIIDYVKTGSTLEWVAERIHAHCPFKRDVAYMPVPHCESCAHWRHMHANQGGCGYANNGEDIERRLWADMYDDVVTSADFGCVQWKEK